MNEAISNGLQICLRTVTAFFVLFLLTRLMRSRSLSQFTYYDYIMGITIGSIAAVLAVDDSLPFFYPVLAMIIFASLTAFVSYLTTKSLKVRRFFSGTPTILVYKGKIVEKNMKDRHVDINELLSECRAGGYFDLADIEFAVMEMNGKLSVLPKSEKQPVTPKDMQLHPSKAVLTANIIIDGKIMEDNLSAVGKDKEWLNQQLSDNKVEDIKEVFLATANQHGQFSVYLKGKIDEDFDCFV